MKKTLRKGAQVKPLPLNLQELAVLALAVDGAFKRGEARLAGCFPGRGDLRVLQRLDRRLCAKLGVPS